MPPRPTISLVFSALALCALAQCTGTPAPLPDAQSRDSAVDSPEAAASPDAGPDGLADAQADVDVDVDVDADADAAGSDTDTDAGADARETAGDTVAPPDGAPGDAADGSRVNAPSTPAAKGALPLPFGIDIGGDITGMGMSVSIKNNVGTLYIGTENFPVIVYEQIPWPGFSYTLYQALAVLPDRWAVIWFYCSGTKLTNIDYEDTRGAPLAVHDAIGTCSAMPRPVTTPVETIASAPQLNSLVQGFRITGPALSYDGSTPGSMHLAGQSWTVHPFNLIDCSTHCGSPGWYELHSLYWNQSGDQTCFGIFYLQTSSPSSVLLEYSICLPLLDRTPPDASITSSWTKTP